jgi:two-component system, NtrC family, response regulator HydG
MSEQYQLVAVSGARKGDSWAITEEPLVFGRDQECQVTLADGMVSRRQCQLFMQDGQVFYEDLGSRNQALINGHPCVKAQLHSSDDIAIGHHRFLLSSEEPSGETPLPTTEGSETQAWGEDGPVTVEVDTVPSEVEQRPGTVQEFVLLYEMNRELSAAHGIQELIVFLRKWLHARFQPAGLWIALAHAEEDLVFYGGDQEGGNLPNHAPRKEIRQALRQRQALMNHTMQRLDDARRPVTVLVSPMTLGQETLGALAFYAPVSERLYDEEDLRMLALMAQSVAPILCAVTTQEQLRRDHDRLRARAGESNDLVGRSSPMKRLGRQISHAAQSSLHVLITGETGTGKELVARSVQTGSRRATLPFVIVNCAAIPRELFESELFGHEQGAFTGAQTASEGLMAQAHGGILFLDEVGDLCPDNQARILRAVEQGTFRRVGGTEEVHVDVRIVAATNRDLREAIQQNSFREDLYHRLSGFELTLPPLRDRISDIPLLAHHFFDLAREDAKRPIDGVAPEALEALAQHTWPGNVRELKNCIFRAVAITRSGKLQAEDIRMSLISEGQSPVSGQPMPLRDMEKAHIEGVLDYCAGNVRDAAKVLGIARSTLYTKLAEYDLR